MEYIEGRTLAAFTKPGKLLSECQAASLVKKVALAVEAAHQQGMIHRALKPCCERRGDAKPNLATVRKHLQSFSPANRHMLSQRNSRLAS